MSHEINNRSVPSGTQDLHVRLDQDVAERVRHVARMEMRPLSKQIEFMLRKQLEENE